MSGGSCYLCRICTEPWFPVVGGSYLAKSRCTTCGHEAAFHRFTEDPSRVNNPVHLSIPTPEPSSQSSQKQGRSGLTSELADTLQIGRIETPAWVHGHDIMDAICPRTRTVEKLLECWEESRVLHIRATPSSGKSVLAMLVRAYIQYKNPKATVILTDMFYASEKKGIERLKELLESHGRKEGPLRIQDAYILIDEGQLVYNDISLWNTVKQLCKASSGIHIAIFAAIGSPTAQPLGGTVGTPHTLGPEMRISIYPSHSVPVGVYLNRQESHDLIDRYGEQPTHNVRFSVPTKQHFFNLSGGHAGSLKTLCDIVLRTNMGRSVKKLHGIVTLEVVEAGLGSIKQLISMLEDGHSSFRGIPADSELYADRAFYDIMSECLRNGKIVVSVSQAAGLEKHNPMLHYCYHQGYLHSDIEKDGRRVALFFPSTLHRIYSEYHCYESPIQRDFGRLDKFKNGLELAVKIIRNISKPTLVKCAEHRRDEKLTESTYQDEYYRAAYHVLGDIFLISEWTGSTGLGRIDFFLPFGRNWAFELLRDGSKAQGHIDRFLTGGAYHDWLKNSEISEYYLLNFCSNSNGIVEIDNPFFYNVVYENYDSCRILDHKGRQIDSFKLLRH